MLAVIQLSICCVKTQRLKCTKLYYNLHIVLYGCELLSVKSKEVHRPRVSEENIWPLRGENKRTLSETA